MLLKTVILQARKALRVNATISRTIHHSLACMKKEETAVIPKGLFENNANKNKNTYIDTIRIFINRDDVYRRGHVEFIYAAMKNMEEYGVNRDLEVYKALIDVLPKGKFIPQNIIQAEFMHYPKQQQCIIDLLEQMEDNGVMPDFDMEDQLLSIFGKRGYPLRKFWRMMYWMPKFKNLSPWLLPNPVPEDALDLAKLAIERISSVDLQSEVKIYQTADIKDSIEDTWIISAQSPIQKKLLNENGEKEPVYVKGPYKVWLRNRSVNYFMLQGKPKPVVEEAEDTDDVGKMKVPFFGDKPPLSQHLKIIPSVHEQEDGVIFSVCATGTSSKDSLLSWIRHLEKDGNPILETVPCVFTLKQPERAIAPVGQSEETEIEEKK